MAFFLLWQGWVQAQESQNTGFDAPWASDSTVPAAWGEVVINEVTFIFYLLGIQGQGNQKY